MFGSDSNFMPLFDHFWWKIVINLKPRGANHGLLHFTQIKDSSTPRILYFISILCSMYASCYFEFSEAFSTRQLQGLFNYLTAGANAPLVKKWWKKGRLFLPLYQILFSTFSLGGHLPPQLNS